MSESGSTTRQPSLARQLLTWYAIAVLIVLLVLGVVLNRILEDQLLNDLTDSLESQALLLRSALVDGDAPVTDAILIWANEESLRVTLIAPDGTVLADSSREVAGMENHAQRPEVVAALNGTTGVASRISASVGVEYRYVAVPPAEAGRVVRVAEPVNVIAERLQRLRTVIALAGLGAALVGVFAVWLIARRIVRPIQEVTESAVRIATGDRGEVGDASTVELSRMADTVNRMAGELHRRAQLSEEEHMVRDQILDALEEGVILIGADDSVAYANRWARSALGERGTLAELPGPLQELAARTRSASGMVVGDLEYGVPPRRFLASGILPGETGSVVLVLQDVTDALRVAAMRRDFVADASHELKTPISAIQAGSETILHALDEDPEAARTFAEQVRFNAVRLGRIVAELLDLSRIETDEPVFERVRIDELVRDEVARVAGPHGDVPVDWSLETTPVSVRGSYNDLRLAARNLLDNAQRYGAGGRIGVSVDRRRDEAVLEVADDGIGIPSRDLPRVFERFYRVDAARSRNTGGTGLGLAIVKHVAERHGGRVTVESELGNGATFRLYLPVHE